MERRFGAARVRQYLDHDGNGIIDPEPLGEILRLHHTVGQDASPILHWSILSLMPA